MLAERGGGWARRRSGERGLAQRDELERRADGVPHQLAQRAGGLAAGRRGGEHAFEKLGGSSDRTGDLQAALQARVGARVVVLKKEGARELLPSGDEGPGGRPGGEHPARNPRPAADTVDPSDDQTSTFVRTFSTTARVNSDVGAWPPRSTVLVPVATVSSTPS